MQRTCTTPGCGKTHRAKGLCSTCYNQQHQTPEQRHAKVTVPCTHCGAPCVKDKGRDKRYDGLFCDLECRDAWLMANGGRAASLAAAHAALKDPRRLARLKLERAARGTQGPTRVMGFCHRCGDPYIGVRSKEHNRFCSRACLGRAKSSIRRARKRGCLRRPYSRYGIFRRDGWRCHICKRKVVPSAVVPHPMAPVIDHLIPLVHGGADSAHNVATAHFMCNAHRREVGPAQLLLFG